MGIYLRKCPIDTIVVKVKLGLNAAKKGDVLFSADDTPPIIGNVGKRH